MTARLATPLLEGTEYDREIRLEEEAILAGAAKYRKDASKAASKGRGSTLRPVERLVATWIDPVTAAIRREIRHCRVAQTEGRSIYGPVLLDLAKHPEQIAAATITTTMNACIASPRGASFTSTSYAVGNAIVSIRLAELLAEDHAAHRATLKEEAKGDAAVFKALSFDRPSALEQLTRRFRDLSVHRVNWWAKRSLDIHEDMLRCKVSLGSTLLWILSETACLADGSQAVVVKLAPTKRARTVRLAAPVFDAIERGHKHFESVHPQTLPMIHPPFKWAAGKTAGGKATNIRGGYATLHFPFIKKATDAQRDTAEAGDMSLMYDGINALSATAWSHSPKVLEIARTLLQEGRGEAGLPKEHDPDPPPHPPGYVPTGRRRWDNVDPKIKRQWKHESWLRRLSKIQRISDLTLAHQTIGTAARFGNDPIYFPHNIDYRGRAYPLPQPLNHQGNDLCRGLLRFQRGKAPGASGDRWLRIHAANVWGNDKLSINDRIAWVCDHAREIAKVAADPLDNRWWTRAEKPFQFLAACLALTDDEAAAHAPIQMDGSTNGLQHYAAMTGNREEAELANLCAADESEVPKDPYSKVGQITRALLANDAAGPDFEALVDSGATTWRKLVKQPVMTTLYDVTRSGISRQQMEALGKAGVPREKHRFMGKALTSATVQAVSSAFPSATAAMNWIRDCAKQIAVKNRQALEWETPLGFRVRVGYTRSKKIHTPAGSVWIHTGEGEILAGKHVRAAAPGQVHSLDAAHLVLAATRMVSKGHDFAAVHDSFWTHAAGGDELSVALRSTFARMYATPWLTTLHRWWSQHYGMEFPEPPARGDFDVREIMESIYAFS